MAATLPYLLDLTGVAVFAATGALAAARRKHDVVTFAFFATAAGVGGGTLRDLLLGLPVFWVKDGAYLLVCLAVAALVFLADAGSAARERLLLWADAVGLSAYAVLGAAKAGAAGAGPLVSVAMGVLTASAGGILRDVLAGEPSIILRREIYVSAAVAGAALLVILAAAGVSTLWAGVIAFAVAFVIRAGAIRFGWTLPGHRGRPAPL